MGKIIGGTDAEGKAVKRRFLKKVPAITGLRNAVKEKLYTDETNKDKNVIVFDLTEFFTWANNKFQK